MDRMAALAPNPFKPNPRHFTEAVLSGRVKQSFQHAGAARARLNDVQVALGASRDVFVPVVGEAHVENPKIADAHRVLSRLAESLVPRYTSLEESGFRRRVGFVLRRVHRVDRSV